MKTAIRWTAIFLLPLFALAMFGPAAHAATIALTHSPHALSDSVGGIMAVGMLFPMGAPVDVPALERLRASPVGGYEVYEDFLYDTQTYPAAGGAGLQLNFFQAAQADRTQSNLAQPGQLPAPHYFRAQRLFLSPQTRPSVFVGVTAQGRLDDVDVVYNIGRGVLTFANNATNRTRGPYPIRSIGQLGGSRGVIVAGNTAASPIVEHVQNDGGSGLPFDIVLKWGETFTFQITWQGAAQAISANMDLQLALYGWRYVKVG
jgi:hypothetical protein